ncbi:MAG TPA: AarF/UbiB family protein [Thermoanaerobaculia bacterium]|nr:AarF/UbiB family protein [Thermoanaerobaculia bacterium]
MQELLSERAGESSSSARVLPEGEPDAGDGRPKGEVLPFAPRAEPEPPPPPEPDSVVANENVLPDVLPPDTELIRASFFGVAWRLCQLLFVFARYQLAGFFDWLTYERSPGRTLALQTRRAERLRETLKGLGGTFIKLGQQLSIRSDILPPVYCRELAELLDRVPPMPGEYVHEVLSKPVRQSANGQRAHPPLRDAFLTFDFEPVGSASIACVYRARLADGDEVAVKIRRPGIVRTFKTDLAALDVAFKLVESLTILRPTISTTFRSELRLMLLEELDFEVEARYQELFRTYFAKRPKLNTTAPKIYPDWCGREVIVGEYLREESGIWLKDLIAQLEAGDGPYREYLRSRDISPKKIAKQLLRGSHYAFFECPFFHGDPHPGNLFVQDGNRLVLVDFGACGVFAHRERHRLLQMYEFEGEEDIGGMVQCVIGLMEPLPPIDVDTLRRRLEDAWWKAFYGIKSKHAMWWERTSFRLWTALYREVRRQRIPLPLNMLRMIRATLLYDSVSARLYHKVNVFDEYRWYRKRYARRIRRDFNRALIRQIFRGPDLNNYVRLARVWQVFNLALQQAEIFLRKPLPDFSALVSKGWDVFRIFVHWALLSSAVTVVTFVVGLLAMRDHLRATAAEFGSKALAQGSTFWEYAVALPNGLRGDMLQKPGLNPGEVLLLVWAVLITAITFKYLRTMLFRLIDKDVIPGRDGGRLS